MQPKRKGFISAHSAQSTMTGIKTEEPRITGHIVVTIRKERDANMLPPLTQFRIQLQHCVTSPTEDGFELMQSR